MRKRKHRKIKRTDRWWRRTGNWKYAYLPGIRPGARPPNTRDEIPIDLELGMLNKHIDAMIAKGWDRDKIVAKVEAKWGMKKHVAIDYVKGLMEWAEDNESFAKSRKEYKERLKINLKERLKDSWDKEEDIKLLWHEIPLARSIWNETFKEWIAEQGYPEEKKERFRYLKKRK